MNYTRFCTLLMIAFLAVVVPVSVASADLLVRGDPDNNSNPLYDRFVNSSQFIGAGLDFSGVGQDTSGHWATMISSHFFVTAGHYHPSAGDTVTRGKSFAASYSAVISSSERSPL